MDCEEIGGIVKDGIEPHDKLKKPKRVRKKKLYKEIIQMMEFYFSDANLNKDGFLGKQIKLTEDRYIALTIFLKFNRIISTGATLEDLTKACMKSELLEVDEGGELIRRKTPFIARTQEDIDSRTVYVEGLPANCTIEKLKEKLSQYGVVNYISLPKYGSTKNIRGHAFVEFATPESVTTCLTDIGTKEFSLLKPFPKLGNKDMQRLHKQFDGGAAQEPSEVSCVPDSDLSKKKKRKAARELEGTEGEPVKKKIKNGRTEDTKDTGKKKKQIDGLSKKDIRAISKAEWVALRKDYLKNQKEEMSALKKKLKQARELEEAKCENMISESGNQQEVSVSIKEDKIDSNAMDTASALKTLEKTPDCLLRVESAQQSITHGVIKDLCPEEVKVAFVDVDKADVRKATVRMNNPEDTRALMEQLNQISEYTVNMVSGDEEDAYWTKLNQDRKNTFSNPAKKRKGRDKLLEKAAKWNFHVQQSQPMETVKAEVAETGHKTHKRKGKKSKNTRKVFSDSD